MISIEKIGNSVKFDFGDKVYIFPFNLLKFSFNENNDENIDVSIGNKVVFSIIYSEVASTKEEAAAIFKNNLYI